MKKIESNIGTAPKISGPGNIKYCLWVNDTGEFHVQFLQNDASGTFSNLAFSISKYANDRHKQQELNPLDAYDFEDKTYKEVYDNNNGAFLKAVLCHLLPDKT